MIQSKRLLWTDSLKGWLMILVVFGHAMQSVMPDGCFHNHLWNMIYSFHMPAFMTVSGYFAYRVHRNGGGKSLCSRRFLQLMMPYVAWSATKYGISGDYTLIRVVKMVLYPDTSFWFLWVLFFINLIFIFSQWLASRLNIDELVVIALSSLLLLGIMVGMEFRMFGFQFIAYYFVFYTMGNCIHRFPRLQIGNGVVLGLLFICWTLLAWSWNMHELPMWILAIPHIPSSLLQYAYRGVTALLAILFLLGMAPKFLNAACRLNGFLCEIGKVSLGYYTCHITINGWVVCGVRKILPTGSDAVIVGLSFVLCLFLTFCIVEGLKKNKITAKVLLGKL